MKPREFIYFVITATFNKLVHSRSLAYFLSFFTFHAFEKQDLLQTKMKGWLKSNWLGIYAITTLLFFVVNFIWSGVNSRLWPDQNPETRNFLEDIGNLINYLIICQIYAILGICYLRFIGGLRKELKENRLFDFLSIETSTSRPSKKTKLFSIFIILSVSLIIISFYSVELSQYSFAFWFQEEDSGEAKALTAHGFYYIFTNLFLNLLIVSVIAAHLETFAVSSLIGKAISTKIATKDSFDPIFLDKASLKELFLPISSFYSISKILVVVAIVNMYTWKSQDPKFTGLLELSIVLVALIGAAFVSYPRYHIQFWLFKIWQNNNITEYPDIRRPLSIGLASLADVLILGSAMTNLIGYLFRKLGIL